MNWSLRLYVARCCWDWRSHAVGGYRAPSPRPRGYTMGVLTHTFPVPLPATIPYLPATIPDWWLFGGRSVAARGPPVGISRWPVGGRPVAARWPLACPTVIGLCLPGPFLYNPFLSVIRAPFCITPGRVAFLKGCF